jgi:hypothetical protein
MRLDKRKSAGSGHRRPGDLTHDPSSGWLRSNFVAREKQDDDHRPYQGIAGLTPKSAAADMADAVHYQ